MELFTLGAEPRLHGARRPRAGARADRLAERLGRRQGPGQLPLRPEAPRHGHEDDLRQARPLRLAGLVPALRPPPEARVVLRHEALELLRPDDAAGRDRSARSSALYVGSDYAGRARSSRRSSSTRRSTTGPRMVKPPVVYIAGLLRARRRGIDTDAWTWLADLAGQQLFYPPNVAGWDDTRWLDTATFRGALEPRRSRAAAVGARPEGDDKAPLTPTKLLDRALAFWGQPALTPPTHARARRRSPSARDQRRRPELEAGAVPAADRERAAPADRRLPATLADRHDGAAQPAAATSFSRCRARSVAQGRRAGGRGLPGDRAGHAAARRAPGLDRRSFLARSVGLALAVYGATRARARALRRRHRPGARRRPAGHRCSSPSSSTAAPTRSPSSSRTATRDYRSCARSSRSPDAGLAFAEDTRLHWHPAARARSPRCTREGKVTVLPGRSATRTPDQSHFTSRHYWEVGATDPRLQTGWLGRYLDHVGHGRQPAPGPARSTARSQPSLATAKVPVAALDGPDHYDFWAPGVWGQVEDRMLDGGRRARRRRARQRPGARGSRARSPPSRTACASSSRRSAGRIRAAGPVPEVERRASRSGWPGSPRCSPPACRCTASR